MAKGEQTALSLSHIDGQLGIYLSLGMTHAFVSWCQKEKES